MGAAEMMLLSQFWHTVLTVFFHVFGLSLIAFGGVNVVLPAVHHLAVNEQGWMTDRDFANLFAISSIAPGPNFLVLTLVGYKAAGVVGAIASTLALCAPTAVIAYYFAMIWERLKGTRIQKALREGLVPVTVGFIGVSATLLIRAADTKPLSFVVSLATIVVALFTKVNPLWVFAVAAVLGVAGWV
jgi:chromate transporter